MTTEQAELHVHEIADGVWMWTYREPAEDFELHSNETYETREEAQTAARRAYPDVLESSS